MKISQDIRETLLSSMTASLTAALIETSARSTRDPHESESIALVMEAWHQALLRFHKEALGREAFHPSGPKPDLPGDQTFVTALAEALQRNQAAEYLALCIVNANRSAIGWPPLDSAAADSLRRSRREQWNVALDEAFHQRRKELDVQRLSYEQRDAVREEFWADIYSQLQAEASKVQRPSNAA